MKDDRFIRIFGATWAEVALLTVVAWAPSISLLIGDKNGLGYFQEPQGHNIFYAVLSGDILNLAYFFLIAFWIMPWAVNRRAIILGPLALAISAGLQIILKATVDLALIEIWYQDLRSVPFSAHLVENSFFTIYSVILGVGYGALRHILLNSRTNVSTDGGESYLELGSHLNRIRFPVAKIQFIKAEGNYARIVSADRTELVYSSLAQLLQSLPPEQFVRVHRSYILNMALVESLGAREATIDGQTIPISKSGKTALREVIEA